MGFFGSCIYSSDNTTILISNSTFGMNLAWMGGVIFVINTADKIVPRRLNQKSETLWSKQELENGTTNITPDDEVLSDSSLRSTCIVENTYFTNNRAIFEGGIFYVHGSLIIISVKNSFVESHIGFASMLGGTFYTFSTAEITIEVHIDHCHFTYSWALLKGGVIYIERGLLNIFGVLF